MSTGTYPQGTMGDVQAAVEAGLLAAESDQVAEGLHAFVVPTNSKIEFVDVKEMLAKHQDHPARKTGCYHVHDAASFISYVGKHGLAETEVWSDAQGQKIVGVINAHDTSSGEDSAGWGDHTVVYQVALTDAWKAWMALDGKLVNQVDFANHIEDRMVDIQIPDAADLLEIAQSFEANTNVKFESATVLSSGQRQFVFREETTARAGQAGNMTIPKEFVLLIQPFEGAAAFELTARLRYRLRDGQLAIGYQLVRPKDILRAAFVSVSDEIAAGVDAPVFLGTTA
jgi:uncharacterized protein YfdQ (DUF2303 family)